MKAELLSSWGCDLTVVNNARVSFDKETSFLTNGDKRLIGYLARGCTLGQYNDMIEELRVSGEEDDIISIVEHWRKTPTHWVPFANGTGARIRVTAPIPIMRQLFKHKIGGVESEVSRRYVSSAPTFERPKWRKAAPNVKQGSAEEVSLQDQLICDDVYNHLVEAAVDGYEELIHRRGICPEQARFILPQGVHTTAIISHSLYGWANVFNQRSDPHSQKEITDLVLDIQKQIEPLFPVSWPALTR